MPEFRPQRRIRASLVLMTVAALTSAWLLRKRCSKRAAWIPDGLGSADSAHPPVTTEEVASSSAFPPAVASAETAAGSIRRCTRFLADFLFGFDIFISYAHKDGTAYPDLLAEALRKVRYNVFVDRRGYMVGDDLDALTRRYVRKSNTLVVIAGHHALESKWVLREVKECLAAGRRVVPIDFKGALAQVAGHNAVKRLLGERLHLIEVATDADGPSQNTIRKIQEQFVGTRQEVVRLRAISATAAGFAILGIFAMLQWREAARQRDEAAKQLIRQRVNNGTRAVVEGDLWGAWSWYANALALAEQFGLDEGTHRERLNCLRQEVPHLLSMWSLPEQRLASVISADGGLVAIHSRERSASSHPHIEIFDASSSSPQVTIGLGDTYLKEMLFSPGGAELWVMTSHVGSDEKAIFTVAIYDSQSGAEKAVRKLDVSHPKLRWIAPDKVSIRDKATVHLVQMRRDAIDVETRWEAEDAYVQAISPDANLIASYSYANEELIVRSSSPARTWRLPFKHAPTVCFSPDSRHLICIETHKVSFLALDGEPRKVAESELEGFVEETQFDPVGHLLLTEKRRDDQLVSTLWRVENGSRVQVFDHDKMATRWEYPTDPQGTGGGSGAGMSAGNPFERCAMFSADGNRLVTVSKRSQAYRVWDVSKGEVLTPPISHGLSKLGSVRLSADARFIVSSAADGLTKLWDVALPRRFKPLIGSAGVVQKLEFLHEDDLLLSASKGRVSILNWMSGETVAAMGENLQSASLAAQGTVIVGVSREGFRLWEGEKFLPMTKWLNHPSIDEATVADDGLFAASWSNHSGQGSELKLWDLKDGGHLIDEVKPVGNWLSDARIDGRRKLCAFLVSANGGTDLYVYDLKSKRTTLVEIGARSGELKLLESNCSGAGVLVFDGRSFWLLGHPSEGAPQRLSDTHSSLNHLLAATSDGQKAVITDEAKQIAQVVSIGTGLPVSSEFRHEWAITEARITPDGSRLLTISGNKAHVWDLNTGDAIVPVVFHPEMVTAAALHPRSSVIATASAQAVDDRAYAIFLRSIKVESGNVASLVAYGQVSGQQRVDQAGARLPLSPSELISIWTERVAGDRSVLDQAIPQIDWFRRMKSDSGSYIQPKLYFLDKILEVCPDDIAALLERAHLNKITGKKSEFAADLSRLENVDAAAFNLHLEFDEVREYGGLLVRCGRPRMAYHLLTQNDRSREDLDGWIYALASYGAGEISAYQSNARMLVKYAREIASQDAAVEVKWNAAFYAAYSSMFSEKTRPEFEAALILAEAARNPSAENTLHVLKAFAALKSGDLVAAESHLETVGEYLMGKALAAELCARRGDGAGAKRLLAELNQELDTGDDREVNLEMVHIKYLQHQTEEILNAVKP